MTTMTTPIALLPDPPSARAIFAAAVERALPPARISTPDWAAAHRWTKGARAGLWKHETAPYLVAPMADLDDPVISTVVVPGPGQSAKTSIAENWLLKSIDTDPADFGWYVNTDDVRDAYVKERIAWLIEAHDRIAARIGRGPTDNSLRFKRFAGMVAHFLSFTESNLVNKTFQRIVADEWDAYDPAVGNPKSELDIRRQTYGRLSKLLAIGHMERATGTSAAEWTEGIMALYAQSTRCTWWWPCPRCGGYSSPNPGTPRHMALVYPSGSTPEDARRLVHLKCPCCEAAITEPERIGMNRSGRWLARGESIAVDGTVTGEREPNPIAGYWIVGAMSPFLLEGIGGLAAARAEAEIAVERADPGALGTLRTVMAKQWGVPFVPPKSARFADPGAVADRAEKNLTLGTVPAGVRFLTAFIDVQANRFELLVRGFGPGFESWVIDVRRIPAEAAFNPDDWDTILRETLEAAYPLADGSGRVMRIRAVGCDSGGEAGVTTEAYAAWKRARRHEGKWAGTNLVRYHGQVSNRDAWSLLLTKGASSVRASRLVISYPDGGRKDRHASARGEVPLGIFNADMFKDALQAQLARAEPGPPMVHIPAALTGNWPAEIPDGAPPHLWINQLFAEERRPDGHWIKPARAQPNEAMDLMVGTHVIAHLHASRIDWSRPPAWAAEWDRNSLVGAATTALPARRAVQSGLGGAPAAAATPPATLRRPFDQSAALITSPAAAIAAARPAARSWVGRLA